MEVIDAASFVQPATGFGWLINEQERILRPPELRDPPAFHASLLLHPVIIETTRKQRSSGWATWLSGGLYLYSDEVYEVGLAYAAGDGAAAGERYAMMTFTAEF